MHLAAIGHPVVGDGAYGGSADLLDVPRPYLHAAAIGLRHPVTHSAMRFESPLPADLAAVDALLDGLAPSDLDGLGSPGLRLRRSGLRPGGVAPGRIGHRLPG